MLIAVVDDEGTVSTMDERGGSVVSYDVPGVAFASLAWSPDGSRIAAIGHGPDGASIYVFEVRRGASGGAAEPIVIYRNPGRPPFYLYWTPDGRRLTFLATEPDGMSLRIAPADASAPTDGSGPGELIRLGAPFYFAWQGGDRLLLHVGSGPSAFLGEVGLDGVSVAPALPEPGDFRAASTSRDGGYLAYVRSGGDSSGEIVVASRGDAGEHSLPVYGPAAFVFDPTGDTLASIAADAPSADALPFPIGPLRLMDARSGAVRTVLDDPVIAFFWAPDGRTIAALVLALPGNQTPSPDVAARTALARPIATATPVLGLDVRLVFVDVATGAIGSERTVRLANQFVSGILPYFDQYALSHRAWAPDSSSILLPLVGRSGRTQLVVLPADGTASRTVADGAGGFWSP
jgi:TolB protein